MKARTAYIIFLLFFDVHEWMEVGDHNFYIVWIIVRRDDVNTRIIFGCIVKNRGDDVVLTSSYFDSLF